jgi:hypothetical protein
MATPVKELSLSELVEDLPIYHKARRELELIERLKEQGRWVLRRASGSVYAPIRPDDFTELKEVLKALEAFQ